MKNKKSIIYMLMILSCLSLLVIVTVKLYRTSSEKKDIFIIGMSQANLYEPWRIEMNKEIQEEAKKHSNIKIIFKDAGGDIEKQKKDISDLIDYGSDLLIVSNNDSKQLTTSVQKAHETIPVIVLGRGVDVYDYSLYIGSDTKSIGIQAGVLVGELAGGKKVNVIEVQGKLDSSADKEITSGFKNSISKYKNVTINRTIVGNWQKHEVQDKLEEILKEDKSVNIIFAHSDYMALGAYYAKVNMNCKDIKIIGIDGLQGNEGGIELVNKGMLEGTFTCRPGGKEAIEYATKILGKQKDIPKEILFKPDKITKETLGN